MTYTSEPAYTREEARMIADAYTRADARSTAKPARRAANPLTSLFEGADRASGVDLRMNDDGTVRSVIPQRAADIMHADIRSFKFMDPAFVGAAAQQREFFPTGEMAGTTTTLEQVIMAGSKVLQAGARLLTIGDAPQPSTQGDMVVFPQTGLQYHLVSSAPFKPVLPTPAGQPGEVANSQLSDYLKSATVDLGTLDMLPLVGFRVELSRRQRRMFSEGFVEACTSQAIAMGLGRAVDAALLGLLEQHGAALSPFSLAAAAAKNINFGELTGLSSGQATGLFVDARGQLCAYAGDPAVPQISGIPTELCADMSSTIVGRWSTAAVTVSHEITLLADKVGTDGGLTLTCFANMKALVPDAGYFWGVS